MVVAKAPLTVSASSEISTYGSAIPALFASISGFVGGDTSAVVSGAPSLSTTATMSSGVGVYPITVNLGTLSAANYAFPNLTGNTYTVGMAHLTVTASPASMTYGSPLPVLGATFVGFVNGDTSSVVSGAPSLTTTVTFASGVGLYPIQVGPGTLSAANYDFPNLVAGTLSVVKAPLTVTASSASITYGDPLPPLSATISGFVNGDTPSVVSGRPALSGTATPSSGAGVYPITIGAGTLSAANYDFPNLVDGTLTINKAPLTVTASPASSTYGGPLPSFSATISGFVAGDSPAVVSGSPVLATTATPASSAGIYPITVGVGTLAAANYDFANLVSASLTIGQAPLTVTASPASSFRTGRRLHSAVGDIQRIRQWRHLRRVVTGACRPDHDGHRRQRGRRLPDHGRPGDAVGGELRLHQFHGEHPDGHQGPPDGDCRLRVEHLRCLPSHRLGNCDDQRLRQRRHRERRHRRRQPEPPAMTNASSGAGVYPVTVGLGTLAAANYDFPNLVAGTLTVTKAPLTVTASPASMTYGDPLPTFSAAISGFIGNDSPSVVSGTPSLSTTATGSSGVGDYPINVGVGTLTAANYDFTDLVGSTLTVTKAHLTVTASDASSTFGGRPASRWDVQRVRRRRHAGGRHRRPGAEHAGDLREPRRHLSHHDRCGHTGGGELRFPRLQRWHADDPARAAGDVEHQPQRPGLHLRRLGAPGHRQHRSAGSLRRDDCLYRQQHARDRSDRRPRQAMR